MIWFLKEWKEYTKAYSRKMHWACYRKWPRWPLNLRGNETESLEMLLVSKTSWSFKEKFECSLDPLEVPVININWPSKLFSSVRNVIFNKYWSLKHQANQRKQGSFLECCRINRFYLSKPFMERVDFASKRWLKNLMAQ